MQRRQSHTIRQVGEHVTSKSCDNTQFDIKELQTQWKIVDLMKKIVHQPQCNKDQARKTLRHVRLIS